MPDAVLESTLVKIPKCKPPQGAPGVAAKTTRPMGQWASGNYCNILDGVCRDKKSAK